MILDPSMLELIKTLMVVVTSPSTHSQRIYSVLAWVEEYGSLLSQFGIISDIITTVILKITMHIE